MKKKLKKGMLSLFLSLAILIGLLQAATVRAEEDGAGPKPGIGIWFQTWAEPEAEDISRSSTSGGEAKMQYINFIEAYSDAEGPQGPVALMKDGDHQGCYNVVFKNDMSDSEGYAFEDAAVSWDGSVLTLNNYNVDYSSYEKELFEDAGMDFDEDDCGWPILEVMNTDAAIVVKGECSITWQKGNSISMYFDEGYEKHSGTLSIKKGDADAKLTLSTSGRHNYSGEAYTHFPIYIGGENSEFINEVNLILRAGSKTAEEADWSDVAMDGDHPEDRFHNIGTIDGNYPVGPDNVYIDADGYFYGYNEETGTSNELTNYWKVSSYGRLTRATGSDYQLYYDSGSKTLELKNFVYNETEGQPFYVECDLTLKLTGTNKVTASSGRAIMIEGNLTIVGTGSLEAVTTCEHEYGENGEDYGAPAAMSINGDHFSNECTLVFRAENAVMDLDLWKVPMKNLSNTGTITGRWCALDADGVNMPESQESDSDSTPAPDDSPKPSASPNTAPSAGPSTAPSDDRPSPSNSYSSNVPAVNWSSIIVNLAAAAGENFNVVTGEKAEVPQNVLQAVKNSGTTLALHIGRGVAFSISKENLTDDMIDGGLNLSAVVGYSSIPDDLVNQKASGAVLNRKISMADNRAFGGVVNIHWTLGAENSGRYANLYRYNAALRRLEYVGNYVINKDGQAMFGIVDGADYLLTVTDAKPNEEITLLPVGQYVIVRGDTLSGIAARHGVKLETILSLNPDINNPNAIAAGRTIRVR